MTLTAMQYTIQNLFKNQSNWKLLFPLPYLALVERSPNNSHRASAFLPQKNRANTIFYQQRKTWPKRHFLGNRLLLSVSNDGVVLDFFVICLTVFDLFPAASRIQLNDMLDLPTTTSGQKLPDYQSGNHDSEVCQALPAHSLEAYFWLNMPDAEGSICCL